MLDHFYSGMPEVFVKTVSDRVKIVASDEHQGYANACSHLGMPHKSVRQMQKEYVRGNVHTTNMDFFWSLLKRGFIGPFHQISREHLPLHLNEYVFRHTNRENPDSFER
jgi:transposase-like protein